jgi:hypothetical protein
LEPPTEAFDQISFELVCSRGTPSYNSGYAFSKIHMADSIAVHSPNDACSIVFEFQDNLIKVTQIGLDSDCGFGHGVYASGIYSLIDDSPPVLGCMRLDNPCGLPISTP